MVSFDHVNPFFAELEEGRFYSKSEVCLLLWIIYIFICICSLGPIIISNIVSNKCNVEYGHMFPGFLPPSEPFQLIGSRGNDMRAEEAGKGMKGWKATRKYVVHIWKLFLHTSRHSLAELRRGELLAFSLPSHLLSCSLHCSVPYRRHTTEHTEFGRIWRISLKH